MLNDNHKFCVFADQTVSYLYGESSPSEKTEYESHLKTCAVCADEIAGFGFVRSAVLDWRNEDFAKLPTPVFDVSAIESKNSISPATKPIESRSWFGGFGKIFSFNPALASFAVLAVFIAAALFAFRFSGGEIAGNENDAILAETAVVSPTVEEEIKPEETIAAGKDSKMTLPADVITNDSPHHAARKRQIAVVNSAVKVSEGSPKFDADSSPRNLHDANSNIKVSKKITTGRKKQVPNLNDVEDEEDKTIRLADLFDEIDAR